ncbi:MAG TPA: thermostable hemolysin [Steroidobacter sp.]|uniref:thermostable hemolysin n=1 Tax=Steroidobacter sp. TaxID=1978227 RepID=UPI002ED79C06
MTGAGLEPGPEPAPEDGARGCHFQQVCLYHADDPRREELERFIYEAFALNHGARVCSFMPTLLAMRNDAGRICSAAGFRCAAEQQLFLERYLDEPIEHAIASSLGQRTTRSQIVEVGNLAGLNCRSAMRLVIELPRILLDRDYRWIVFTATDTVRALLATYSARLLDLAPATAVRVQDSADDWGRYYESHPRVMVGHLPNGLVLRHRRSKE